MPVLAVQSASAPASGALELNEQASCTGHRLGPKPAAVPLGSHPPVPLGSQAPKLSDPPSAARRESSQPPRATASASAPFTYTVLPSTSKTVADAVVLLLNTMESPVSGALTPAGRVKPSCSLTNTAWPGAT